MALPMEGQSAEELYASGRGTFVAEASRKKPDLEKATDFVGGSPPARNPEDASFLLEAVRREAYLVIASGPRHQAEFMLRGGTTFVLGRDEAADLVIDDESASRRHAVIEKHADGYYLRDLGSSNGTYLNGLLHAQQARLIEGQRFRIGQTEFIFHDETRGEATP
jgi:hypothetical protein